MIPAWKVYFKIVWVCKTPLVFLMDFRYKEVELGTLKAIASKIKRSFGYLTDVSDCDDAAWIFKGEASRRKENGVGFVIGLYKKGLHCWNMALSKDKVFHIEPQTGKLDVDKSYHAFIVVI